MPTKKSLLALSLSLLAPCAFGQGACVPPKIEAIVALPSGTMISHIGTCDLPVTTKSDHVRQLVRQGFQLIHCFWFNEAVRSFRDATKEDPTCAVAWLGLNMSLTLPWHSPGNYRPEADYAIQRAVATCGDAGPLEQALVAAFRLRSYGVEDRESEFEKAMMRVIEINPKDFEPRLMLAAIRTQLCMNDDYDEKFDPRTELSKVLVLIQPVLAKDPQNAAALHYHVHSLEGSRPDLAVISADRLAKAAPASGHMAHMPGHIYNRVGMYEKARQAFLESVRVHEEYATKIPGATANVDWNYAHDLDYLIFNLSEMGRLREANEYLKKNTDSWKDLAWRTGDWQTIATKTKEPFFVGMAAITQGNIEAASAEADKLEAGVAKNAGNQRGWMITRARTEQIQAAELRGMILSKQGRHIEAKAKLAEAVAVFEKLGYSEPPFYPRPPYESQAYAAMAAGRPSEAITALQNGLKSRPRSGWMLYGIAFAQEKSGRKEAKASYEAFLKAWASADEELPQMVHAREFLAR